MKWELRTYSLPGGYLRKPRQTREEIIAEARKECETKCGKPLFGKHKCQGMCFTNKNLSNYNNHVVWYTEYEENVLKAGSHGWELVSTVVVNDWVHFFMQRPIEPLPYRQ